ncbi:MAG: CPBP family intramembrane glutamic endopeptidase [Pseudomonadota bacterium]
MSARHLAGAAPAPGATGRGSLLPFALVLAWCAGAATSAAVGMWPALGVTAVGTGTLALALEGQTLRPLFRPTVAAIVAGLVTGAAMTAATYALYPLVSHVSGAMARDTARLYANLNASSHLWLSLVLVPVVIGEEVVWRGMVHGALARRFGPAVAVLLAAPLYAVAHAPVGSPVLVLAALGCGLIWGGLRATTASLLAPLVAHLLWDEIVLFLAPVAGR